MKILKVPYLLLILIVIVFMACSEDDEIPANTPPVITITSPTDAEMSAGFNRGEQITIIGNVTDDKEISTLHIEVFYGESSLYEEEQTEIGENTYDFTQQLSIPTFAPSGEYSVIFTATDNEGLTSTLEKIVQIR